MSPANTLIRLLGRKETLVAPGVFSPAVAKAAEKAGFEAIYFSGAAFSNLLALPDLGVTTMTEVLRASGEITTQVALPLIVDCDTGFGEALNVARTTRELKVIGAAAMQIEDQVVPKRCGHLNGKELVDADDMVKKIVSAKEAAPGGPLVIARTDARGVEGIDGALERASLYEEAGADIIFPEALESKEEFAEFRSKVKSPLMANMTEFGKTPYLSVPEFHDLGYNIVIFPVTTFRSMMKAVTDTLTFLKRKGTQRPILDSLMGREEFYDLIDYHRYEETDAKALAKARRMRE